MNTKAKKSYQFVLIPLIAVVFALSAIFGALGIIAHSNKAAPTVAYAAEAEEDYNTFVEGRYFVSPNGNDNNDGRTLNTAWKSVAMAALKMSAMGYDRCKEVIVADGVYYETEEIKPNAVIGTKERPAVFRAMNKWGAKVISTSIWHGVFICCCQYFVFDGFVIDFPATKTHHFGIAAFMDETNRTSNHITIRNCVVTNAASSGIQVNMTDNAIIENNIVYRNALKENGNNGSGISVYHPIMCPENLSADDNDWGIVIRNNYVWQNNCLNNCPGFDFPTDGNGIIIDDYQWTQDGKKYPYTKKTLVENNVVFDNGGRGIHVFISNDTTIRNNTVYQNGWTVMKFNAYGNGINLEQGFRNEVYNNVVFTLNSITSTALNDKCTDTKYANNVVVGTVNINNSGSFPAGSNGTILTAAQADSVGLYNPSNDLAFLNFSPKADSMLLNAGDATHAPDYDIMGNQRSKTGGKVTIGAYEVGNDTYGIPTEFFQHYQSEDKVVSFRTPNRYTDKVGNPSDDYKAVRITADAVVASLYEANTDLTCKSVSIYLKNIPGKFNIAVYSDNEGEVGSKLAETGVQNGVSEEKQYTYNLDKAVNVEESQKIWIALFLEGSLDTYICAYDVSSSAKVSFMEFGDSAPTTFEGGVMSSMLLSANLNGTAPGSGNAGSKGCGSSMSGTVAPIVSVMLLLSAAGIIVAKKRKSNI